eukprot:457457_1
MHNAFSQENNEENSNNNNIKDEDKWKFKIGKELPKMIHSQLCWLARILGTRIPTSNNSRGNVNDTRNKLYQLILGSHASINDPKKMYNLVIDISKREEKIKNQFILVNKMKNYNPDTYLLDINGKKYDYHKHINYYNTDQIKIISNVIENA